MIIKELINNKEMSVVRLMLNSFFILDKLSMLNKLDSEIFKTVDNISPITNGMTVFIIDLKKRLSFIFSIMFTSSKMIINEGKITPVVAIIAPSTPSV